MKSAVVLVACKRLNYFQATLESILPQLEDRPLLVVLDKEPKTGDFQKIHLEYLSGLDIPSLMIKASKEHLGLGRNMIRARTLAFEDYGFDQAFILEDDLVLGPNYFEFCESLLEWAQTQWVNIGIVQGWRNSYAFKDPREIHFCDSHFWGYLQTRASWETIRPQIMYFRDTFLEPGVLYSRRPHAQIVEWKQSLIKQLPIGNNFLVGNSDVLVEKLKNTISGQDGITMAALHHHNLVRLCSGRSIAKYIGEKGEHFTKKVFLSHGLNRQTSLMDHVPLSPFTLMR